MRVRVTYDRLYVELQLKRSVKVPLWSQEKEKSIGKDRNSVELNHYIDALRVKFYQIYQDLELEGKIMQSVSSLPEFTREIFEMSRHDGLKYEEIAARKNITIDIVKYHIRLSLNQLRHDLRDYLPFWLTLFLFM